jgi:hypothetical protein
MSKSFVRWVLAAATAAAAPAVLAQAAPQDDVARLQRELQELRRDYDQRLAALEERLRTLQAAPAQPAPTPEPTPAGPPPPLPATALSAASSSKVFNPDIAVIGDFLGAVGRNRGPGAPPAPFELHEAEAAFQAIVDPYARADFFFSFTPEGIDVEEGFITFPTLPAKLLLKAGKMRAGFGKSNTMHTHVLPWTDRPLVTQNLVGGDEGIADYGVSVARLIPLGETFLEATGEVFRGQSGIFKAPRRQDLSYVGRLRGYRDVSEAANLDVGASIAYGHNGLAEGTTTRLFGVDATFRYRPLRRALYRRFIARGEAVWSRAELPTLTHNTFGSYLSAEYQFAQRWFAGARFDVSGRAVEAVPNDKGGSLILTFWPSEFSQVRGQYRYTRLGPGGTNNEFLLQLLFSIGAHGAHAF